MDSLDSILQIYQSDQRLQELRERISSDKHLHSQISGMIGAQETFVLSGLLHSINLPFLILCNTKEEAAYYYNNLQNINPKFSVWYFPDSCKVPGHYQQVKRHQVLQRTEVINRISGMESKINIIVTYPEAIIEKVVSPIALDKSRILISITEVLDIDFLIEMLVEFGFESVDFAYEPGQFSIRGGIIDIFSFGNEWPYRIELFDDEVESIRMFDPESQLSIKKISKLSIVPNVNAGFEKSEKVNLFEIIPVQTLLWINDFGYVLDKMQEAFDKWQNPGLIVEDPENMPELSPTSTLMERFQSFSKIFIQSPAPHFNIDLAITIEGRPQPSFNKNFDLLIKDLKEKEKNNYQNFLFTDNKRQIQRFESIFQDLNANVRFQSILKSIDKGFIDPYHRLACYTDHQIFQRYHKYKLRSGFTRDKAINLKFLRELTPGDYVTHIDHGVGRYSGLEKININGHEQESVRLIYQNNDVLYVSIQSLHKISKYIGKDGQQPRLDKLGSDVWTKLKKKTKKKVKALAFELIKLYAKRKASEGFAFPPDGYLQNELEASFFYEDTPDQLVTTQDVKADMEKPYPMDRLICGDVGFGKTEIAIRAAFKAVVNGKQVAVLVPTTILALQHYKTFGDRLNEFGIGVDYVNRFKSTREKNEIFSKLKSGEIEIVIGTHALLNKKVGFKDLGLLIIDEEQKFGVGAKELLRNLKINVDTLTLTATPIPRTLQFSLMAARDLSIIRTAPPNRQSIYTEVRIFNEELIKDAIYYEINRGGQVFFVHNRVKNLGEMAAVLQKMCPDVHIQVAHGQMESKNLEKALVDFIEGKFDVLLCTNIIETGLDIPNANTIIINNAHHFGLSDLHQLRGRVGRSNRKAFCYLFCPPLSTLTPEARKRLRTIEEFSELGSGFNIAMRDLDIRGSGNLLGAEQSGFISEIGYETYQKILEEAIQELKENEYKDLFEDTQHRKIYIRDVQIDTDIEMLIPDEYVNNIQERLNLYSALDGIEDEENLANFQLALEDRFGKIPKRVFPLFDILRIRWICKQLGFERMVFKNNTLKLFFVMNAQSSYYNSELFQLILAYLGRYGEQIEANLKQSRRNLILNKADVSNLKGVLAFLQTLVKHVLLEEAVQNG